MSIGRPRNTATTFVPIVAIVLAGFLAGCSNEPVENSHDSGSANLAFLDVPASHAVLDQIAPAVVRFYSYDFRRIDEHAAGIREVSTARYWSDVGPMLEIIRTVAPSKQAVATAEVVATALHSLGQGRAEVLLFVNRSTVEAGGAPQREGSSIVVTAARVGPQWKIDGMRLV